MDLIFGILDLFNLLFLFSPFERGDVRAKRRREMEELDRRVPKKWEGLV